MIMIDKRQQTAKQHNRNIIKIKEEKHIITGKLYSLNLCEEESSLC
jgi:hypothetical protein